MISDQVRDIPVVAALSAHAGSAIEEAVDYLGQLTLYVDPTQILEICRFLKQEQKFVRLAGLTGVDWHPMEPRFEVVYLLHSLESGQRLRLKCRLPGENPELESVTSIWRGANWYERETFDLFGIRFLNHPKLARIMMPDGWEGHPLRRDFPVHGHRYDYASE